MPGYVADCFKTSTPDCCACRCPPSQHCELDGGHAFRWHDVVSQVAWQKGSQVQQVWRDVVALLAYPHVWIRKAAGRLLGLLLSSTKLGQPHVALPHPSPVLLCITSHTV